MIKKIKQNISSFEFSQFGSLVYLIKLKNKNIIIDTGSKANRKELIEDLEKLNLVPENIDILILTHNHFDHVGNISLFTNAKIFASKLEFSDEKIIPIDELKIPEFKIIKTPGHTKGSFCILYDDVLFSGDTIFHNGGIGRMDLEGGSEVDMKKSLEVLSKVKYKILCPGH
ncbi:MAG: MBL fold metallo-hydrolase [Candidatus Pacearchaeota archaeon]|jgi:glyoxylase-like metal-dependent hydrolase (beta-lactamase superfamily II)